MDISELLQEAATETAVGKKYNEEKEQQGDNGYQTESVKFSSSSPSDVSVPSKTRSGGLKGAAQKVAKEEREQVIEAMSAADSKIEENIREERSNAVLDKNDIGGLLGHLSEDIHNNKIRLNDTDEVDQLLNEAAQEMQDEEEYGDDLHQEVSRAYESSGEESDDEEADPGDDEKNRELIICCSKGNSDRVHYLLSHGASFRCRDRHGWTPLHWAASKGFDDIVSSLIDCAGEKAKKYVNLTDDLSGWTALHVAAVGGHVKCIKVLVANKAKIHKKNKIGEVPADGISFAKSTHEWESCVNALGLKSTRQQADESSNKNTLKRSSDRK